MPSKFLMKSSILDTVGGVWGNGTESAESSYTMRRNKKLIKQCCTVEHVTLWMEYTAALGLISPVSGWLSSQDPMEFPQGPGPGLSLVRPNVFLVLDREPSQCSRASGQVLGQPRPPQPPPRLRVGPHHQTSGQLASLLVFRGSY